MQPNLKFIDFHTHQSFRENIIQIKNYDFDDISPYPFHSIGHHPWRIEDSLRKLDDQLFYHENCIAIGESGLDKAINLPLSQQISVFKKDIALAQSLNKPMIIHCVKAYQECLRLLNGVTAIFHGFNKHEQLAHQIIRNQHVVSFGAALLKHERLQHLWTTLPLTQVVLETDESDVEIEEIYFLAAKLRKIEIDKLILQQHKNFKTIFNINI